MSSHVPAELRRLVARRAGGLCEYCLIHEDDTFFGCEVDHIVSEKHDGPTDEGNLALACFVRNRRKGSDLGSFVPGTNRLCRFFHPRVDRWPGHFSLANAIIEPLTEIGEVTARIFGFNDPERLRKREELRASGRFPSIEAMTRMA